MVNPGGHSCDHPAMPGGDAQYYFLLVQATNAVRRAGDRAALAAAGVTTAQAGALYAIAAADHPSQRQLGTLLGLGEAAVTGLVNRLEKLGLVAREADPGDRRTRRLGLTDAGRRTLGTVEPARLALNARIAALLADDADIVAAALRRLADLDPAPPPAGTADPGPADAAGSGASPDVGRNRPRPPPATGR